MFVRYQIGKNVDAGVVSFTITVLDGTVPIEVFIHQDVPVGWQIIERVIPEVQLQLVTNWDDIRVRVEVDVVP